MEHARKKKIKTWQIVLLAGAAVVLVGAVVCLVLWLGRGDAARGPAAGVSQSASSQSQSETASSQAEPVSQAEPAEAVSSQVTPAPASESEVSPAESPVSAASQPEPDPGVRIGDFPVVYQLPELPTGCEITALTMALQYYGLDADKTEMAADYLPTSPSTNRYTGSDGRVYGIDLDAYFVGNPFDDSGMICGPAAIVTAANGFLADQGSSLQAADRTGASPDALYALVEQNTPVVVWVTIGMPPRQPAQMSWYTETGKYVDWTNNDHCAVLVGYTDSSVWIADPLAGLVEYSKTSFERVFASRGNRCVVLQ